MATPTMKDYLKMAQRTEHARLAAEDPDKANAYLGQAAWLWGHDPYGEFDFVRKEREEAIERERKERREAKREKKMMSEMSPGMRQDYLLRKDIYYSILSISWIFAWIIFLHFITGGNLLGIFS